MLSFSANVNFQPASSTTPAGYVADSGQTFEARGNGFSYGWNVDNTANVRERPATIPVADNRFHTLAMMQAGGANKSWEIAVPNGAYLVHVVAGDPTYPTGNQRILAEFQTVVSGSTNTVKPWVDGWAKVDVTDGRLTLITGGGGSYQTKINSVEITDDLTTPPWPATFPQMSYPLHIGMNIDALSFYSTVAPFNDLASEFNQWGGPDSASKPDTRTAELNANNYPLGDAAAITFATGYPSGDYAVSYRGTGRVRFYTSIKDENGQRIELPFTPELQTDGSMAGTVHLDIPATIEGNYFIVKLTEIDPENPVSDLHILSPDSNPDPTNPFRPVFLQKLAAFDGPLRMMGWGQTNFSPMKFWSDQVSTSRFSFFPKGVPIEYQVKLANVLHKDIWINVPHLATPSFVQNLAAYLRDNLDPTLKVYVEYSNETWNPSYSSIPWAPNGDPTLGQQSNLLVLAQRHGITAAQEMGLQTLTISESFKQVFGASRFAGQVRPILGAFVVNGDRAREALAYIESIRPGHRANEYISGIAVAPYVGSESDMGALNKPDLTLDELFGFMNDFVDNALTPWIASNKAVADQYEVSLEAYEGGIHIQALNVPETEAVKLAAQSDPRMADFLRHLMTKWVQLGGGNFVNFTLAMKNTPSTYWGLLDNIQTATSVKYATMASLAGTSMTFTSAPEVVVPNTPTTPTPQPAPQKPVSKPNPKPAVKPAPPKPVIKPVPPPPLKKPTPFARKRLARVFD